MRGPYSWSVVFFPLAYIGMSLCQVTEPVLEIQSAPARPIVERRDGNQFVNADLIVRNTSSLTMRIWEFQVSVYDTENRLILRRSLNTDAYAPSIAVIGQQTLNAGEQIDIFNPFYEFDGALSLNQVEFSFCLLRETNESERVRNSHRLPDDCDFRQNITIMPRKYEDRTPLILPLRGKIFVWEGHDFYAHHVRVPLGSARVQSRGITANSNNFASDFIYLDKEGRPYRDDPRKLVNWYGYGKAVFAPGAGVVRAAANDIPDNSFEDERATRIAHPKLPPGQDPKDIGNFVLIDHQNGEYSLLVHLKPGSVLPRTGDSVSQGQLVGQIGFSGDSIFPHLHYSLMDGPEVFKAWGLPAYFSHFHRLLGATSPEENHSTVNSGDFVESDITH